MNLIATIGLEVHAQLKTKTKLFCACENAFGKEPNSLTCPVCLGLPGALPVTNGTAILFAIRAGAALHCTINSKSIFARKNYFYPDLPKGYQISQYDQPLCSAGKLTIEGENGPREIGITRIHVEEDAGKLLHNDKSVSKDGSLVDLNRAGVPLIEIVSEPDIQTPKEAAHYLRKLRSILRYLDVCDGNMEEGSLRCDANVSVRPEGQATLGAKVEVKNMNSFKHVQKAIEFEIERQSAEIKEGRKISQETRLYNPDKNVTSSMRSKEEAHDYRYFPEPDLLPLELPRKWVLDVRHELPELPDDRRKRFETALKLPPYDADVLTAEKEIADYFEEALKAYGDVTPEKAKTVSNYVMAEVMRLSNELHIGLDKIRIRPADLAAILRLIDGGKISGKIAKEVLNEIAESGGTPEEVISAKGLEQVSDEAVIRKLVQEVVAKNPGQKAQYLSGKEKLFGFFVGQVMQVSKGKANPALVNQLLKEELK